MNKTNNNKIIDLPTLNKKQLAEIELLKSVKDEDINLVDIPEITEAQMKTGHLYYSKKSKTNYLASE